MDLRDLICPALGDEVPLGALYDARSDTFFPVPSEDLPEDVKDIKPIGKSTARLTKANTIRDKITALGIAPKLGASILAGLAPDKVYAPYLNHRNGCQPNAAQASLHYTIKTGEEELKPYTNSNRNYRLTEKMTISTHMVIGITYGAEFLVTAHHAASSSDDLASKQARLDSLFESLKAIAIEKPNQPSVSTDEPASHDREGSVFGTAMSPSLATSYRHRFSPPLRTLFRAPLSIIFAPICKKPTGARESRSSTRSCH